MRARVQKEELRRRNKLWSGKILNPIGSRWSYVKQLTDSGNQADKEPAKIQNHIRQTRGTSSSDTTNSNKLWNSLAEAKSFRLSPTTLILELVLWFLSVQFYSRIQGYWWHPQGSGYRKHSINKRAESLSRSLDEQTRHALWKSTGICNSIIGTYQFMKPSQPLHFFKS